MKKFDLGTSKIRTIVLRLALPAMLGQLVNVLYGIIDRIYIGNIKDIGNIALGGVGICAPVTTLLTSFSFLIGVGGAPLLSMSLGEGDRQKATRILSNSFMSLLVLSILVPIITLIFSNQFLDIFGATEKNFIYASTYLKIFLIGAPFAILALGLNQFINCQGFSAAGMKTMLVGAVLNIVLDPIFIFVFKMDVAGAAIATVISQIASFLYTLTFLIGKKTYVKITFSRPDFNLIRSIMFMGLSPFIILATDSVIIISLNSAIKATALENADLYIAVSTITLSFYQLITMPLIGISGGTQAVLSYNFGAVNIDRVKSSIKNILSLGLIFTTVCFLLSYIIDKPFIRLFTRDASITQESQAMIRVYMYGIIPIAIQYCLVDGLTALTQAKPAAFCSLIRKIILISITWLLPLLIGVVGCFYAEPLSNYLGSLITAIVFLMVFPKVLHKREINSRLVNKNEKE